MTTSTDWASNLRPALARMRPIRRHSMAGAMAGFTVVVFIGAAAYLWNALSDGGVIRFFGGVTTQQLSQEITAHPGPPGPAGPRGPSGPPGPPGPAASATPEVRVVKLIPAAAVTYIKSAAIPDSGAYPVCALSNVSFRRVGKGSDGSCRLKHELSASSLWKVLVNNATCSVTCFSLSSTK